VSEVLRRRRGNESLPATDAWPARIVDAIQRSGGTDTPRFASDVNRGHAYYAVSVPELRGIAQHWAAAHRQTGIEEIRVVLDALFAGDSYEEKSIAGILLHYLPQRRQLDPRWLDGWLEQLRGWAEIDSLCQGSFTAQELLARWDIWEPLLQGFAADANIAKRRAALVLLTGPVRASDSSALADLAFTLIDALGHEREILITKAVSWLLRSLVAQHRERVERYLDERSASLPSIAVRETRHKLLTGRK
jgi:3-methyladenine DNA glycosylase AlkD